MGENKINVVKNYRFIIILISSMILGCIVGLIAPNFAKNIKFLGTIFLNMMFCIVVPLVFSSIAGSIATMKSRVRAGKILGVTIAIFIITGTIAAIIMFVLMKIFPPVLTPWSNMEIGEIGEYATWQEMVVNFFTASDFVGLLTRKAMLPLIIFSILFGFSVNLGEGADGIIAKWLVGLSTTMLKFVNIITYYAPIAFFVIFANLVADFGSDVIMSYGRAIAVYFPLCFIYVFTAFPIFAYFGGGEGAIKTMFKHIVNPTFVSLGTCSSIATIPINLKEAKETGISKDVAELVITLGANMHMDGSSFASVLKIAFLFGVFGQPLEWKSIFFIILVAVFSSVGMSGVPGGGYISEYIIASIFFADKIDIAFPVLVAIGNIVDVPATMVNAVGDYVICFVVSKYVDGKDWLQKILKKQNLQ